MEDSSTSDDEICSMNNWTMDDLPDLSHLTEDERKIIEAVIHRQKVEEKRDAEVLQ